MFEQKFLCGLWHTQGLQPCGIAEQREVPLVGVQRMGLRVRRQHHGVLQDRFTQRGAARLLQVEVGQSVVDQVDGQVAVPQHAAAPFQRGRIGDDRTQAVPLEQLLEQQEFGVEILILGCCIDNGDTGQRAGAAGRIGCLTSRQTSQLPFVPKHRDDLPLEVGHAGQRGHHGFHRAAAGMLRSRQHGVEHRSTRVGIDLDQPEMTFTEVKVVAEEDTERPTGAEPRDAWRGSQHQLSIGRKGHHRFDGLHHLRHAMQLRCRHEHGHRREEERTTLANQFRQAGLSEFRIEGAHQRLPVQTEAEAGAVKHVDGAAACLELR